MRLLNGLLRKSRSIAHIPTQGTATPTTSATTSSAGVTYARPDGSWGPLGIEPQPGVAPDHHG